MSKLKLFSKTRKRRASPEAELQKAVVQYLKLAGVPGLLYFSVPNEAKRSPRLANHLRAMGMRPGVSDLMILIPQQGGPFPLFLELKARGEKPSASQRDFQMAVDNVGAEWEWADNLNSAIDILRVYGAIKNVPRRRAASPFSEAA